MSPKRYLKCLNAAALFVPLWQPLTQHRYIHCSAHYSVHYSSTPPPFPPPPSISSALLPAFGEGGSVAWCYSTVLFCIPVCTRKIKKSLATRALYFPPSPQRS